MTEQIIKQLEHTLEEINNILEKLCDIEERFIKMQKEDISDSDKSTILYLIDEVKRYMIKLYDNIAYLSCLKKITKENE